ncbi:MAG: PKD domain-containing protein [Bacteroidota bacterium]
MMKTYFVVLLIIVFQLKIFSQVIILQTDFTGYDGTQVTVPSGWNISWNSTSSPSYYSSTSFSGLTPPSYKFGMDSTMIFTPVFSYSDTLKFWCKGSSNISPQNKLNIYESSDSIKWNMFSSIDSLPTTGKIFILSISPSTKYLCFVYRKVSGNLAFDDVQVIDYPNITAIFSSDTVCNNDSTCFKDLSVSNHGPIVSWNWNFGDGSSSSILQNPCHTYTLSGTYSVSLTVTNSNGDANTILNSITIYSNPTAEFSFTTNKNIVTLVDKSSGATMWDWNFGDGNLITQQNPTHDYTTVGNYTVCLTVTNSFGCKDSACQTITINTVGISENIFSEIFFNVLGMEVYDIVGKKIFVFHNLPIRQSTIPLDLLNQKDGIYFVKIATTSGTVTRKIIIAK